MARERAGPERGHVEHAETLEGKPGGVRRSVRAIAPVGRWSTSSSVCSPEPRGRFGRTKAGRPESERRTGLAAPSRGLAKNVSARAEVLERRDIRAVGDRCVGDAEDRREVEHLVDGARANPLVDRRRQGRAVQEELRVLGPLRVSDHGAEVEPLLPGADAEPDEPVARRADAGGRDEAPAAHRPTQLVVERDRVVGEAHDHRLEHRDVDKFALWIASPAGRERADRGEEPRQPLADLTADVHRRPIGPAAGEPHDRARPRLKGEFRGGPVRPRPFEAERGDRCSRSGAGAPSGSRRAPAPGVRTRDEPRDHTTVSADSSSSWSDESSPAVVDVRRRRSRFDECRKLKSAAVVARLDRRTRGRPPAQRITLGRLDLDDLGPAVREQLGAVRTPDPGGEVDDAAVRLRGCGPRACPGPARRRLRHRQPSSRRRRPDRLNRHSGGKLLSLSFTARFRSCFHRLVAERRLLAGDVVAQLPAHRLEPRTEQAAHVLPLVLLHDLEEHLLHKDCVGGARLRTGRARTSLSPPRDRPAERRCSRSCTRTFPLP